MKGGRKVKNLIEKIWKSIMAKCHNTEPETYCEVLKREKREEEMRVQAAEKKKSRGFAY